MPDLSAYYRTLCRGTVRGVYPNDGRGTPFCIIQDDNPVIGKVFSPNPDYEFKVGDKVIYRLRWGRRRPVASGTELLSDIDREVQRLAGG